MNLDRVTPPTVPQRAARNKEPGLFTYKGRTRAVRAWAEDLGVTPGLILARLGQGESFDAIVTSLRARAAPSSPVVERPITPTHLVAAPVRPPMHLRPSSLTNFSIVTGTCTECAERASAYYKMIHHDHIVAAAREAQVAQQADASPASVPMQRQ